MKQRGKKICPRLFGKGLAMSLEQCRIKPPLGFVTKLNVFAFILLQLSSPLAPQSHSGSEVHCQQFCLCSFCWSGPHNPCYIVANINSLNKLEAILFVSYCCLCRGLISCMTLNLGNLVGMFVSAHVHSCPSAQHFQSLQPIPDFSGFKQRMGTQGVEQISGRSY